MINYDRKRNIDIYTFAKKFLMEHLPEGVTEEGLERYFQGDAKESSELKEVFIVFSRSAQEYQRMPKVIKFEERYDQIRDLLADFDYKTVAGMDENELYKVFRDVFEVTSRDSKSNSWYKWSCAIIDSARFISGFDGFEDFQRFVDRFDYNTETRMALPLLISTKIRGIGFALACNALKELGYLDYPKPDVHMIDICKGLGLCDESPYEVFETIVHMAEDNGVTPYEVDKVLWLISSGRYYKDDITDKPRKDEFIREMQEWLGI